jgi:hypothetical protein
VVKEQQVQAVSELAQVLIDCFDADQIMSFIFGELSRPVNNGMWGRWRGGGIWRNTEEYGGIWRDGGIEGMGRYNE